MISLLADMGMDHLVPEQAAPVIPEDRPVPATPEYRPVPAVRYPPLKPQAAPGLPPKAAPPGAERIQQPAAGAEKIPQPPAPGSPPHGETGAGIRGPTIFSDPAGSGERYELSTANTIIFLRACDRARKGLTPGELVQFRHLWLKVYGNRV